MRDLEWEGRVEKGGGRRRSDGGGQSEKNAVFLGIMSEHGSVESTLKETQFLLVGKDCSDEFCQV